MMINKTTNYRRYTDDNEEDLLSTSGIFRIIYRYLSHKITLKEAVEEATALYEYRRRAAADARIKYYFFSVVLQIIRLVDRIEQSGRTSYQETGKIILKTTSFSRKTAGTIKDGMIASGRTVLALPRIFLDIAGEFFSSIKIRRSEQKHIRAVKKKELEDFKSSKIENFVLSIRELRRSLTSRRTVYFILSIFIHAAIFYFLKFHKPGLPKKPDTFDMYAIQLVDATPQAKDKISTKGEEKHGEKKREKTTEEPGKPEIKQAPEADVRTAQKETHQPLDLPDSQITPKDIAQQEPRLQQKTIALAQTQPQQRQTALSKNIAPKERARAAIPSAMKMKKQYQSRSLMRRRPISPNMTATASARQNDLALAKSVSSLSRTHQATQRVESTSFSQSSLKPQTPAAERKRPVIPTPETAGFQKFMIEKSVEIDQERATLARTRTSLIAKRSPRSSKISFRRTKIANITTPEGEEHEMDSGSTQDTPGKEGDKLSGVKRKESLMTGIAITLRTPLMRGGFTVGDVPQETLKKEAMAIGGPPRRAEMEALKGIKYHGRTASGGPISFTEERVTYKSKSRTILKRVEVSTDELGNVEELDDFSKENRPSAVDQLKNLSKRTLTPTKEFSSSTSSQYFQGFEAEPERKIQGEKLVALAKGSDRSEQKDTVKKLAYNKSKDIKTILKKDTIQKTTALESRLSPEKKITKTGKIKIKADLPMGNITQKSLYTLRGEIGSDVKQAFVTINDVTQMVTVKDGVFVAKIAMAEGINKVNVLAFNSKGEIGDQRYKILFRPRKAVPLINILSPENGKQGLKEGDMILVAGTINDKSIKTALLILNNSKIKIKVRKGRFQHKIFLPANRVNTFRISATGLNGMIGYSPLHTILIGASFDINNPRPY